jgi:hypothetical protein
MRKPEPSGARPVRQGHASDAMIEFRQQVDRTLARSARRWSHCWATTSTGRCVCRLRLHLRRAERGDSTRPNSNDEFAEGEDFGANAASGVWNRAESAAADRASRLTPGAAGPRIAYQASRLVKRTNSQGGPTHLGGGSGRSSGPLAGRRRQSQAGCRTGSAERMKVIRELVSATIGLTAARRSTHGGVPPFESTLTWEPPAQPVAAKFRSSRGCRAGSKSAARRTADLGCGWRRPPLLSCLAGLRPAAQSRKSSLCVGNWRCQPAPKEDRELR